MPATAFAQLGGEGGGRFGALEPRTIGGNGGTDGGSGLDSVCTINPDPDCIAAAGGAGGAPGGGNGANGQSNGFGGGGGGAGSVGLTQNTGSVIINSSISGGSGGAGGSPAANGPSSDRGGGGGGGGGNGGSFSGASITISNAALTGGNGGAGGAARGFARGGGGGAGGTGLLVFPSASPVPITIGANGAIVGGNGGVGGQGAAGFTNALGDNGRGGAGIVGANLIVDTSGFIASGLDGDGVTRAVAINFNGPESTLILNPGATFRGAIRGSNRIVLDTPSDYLLATELIARTIEKRGSGSLTLTSANMITDGTTISSGTLVAGSSGALGTGAVRFDTTGSKLVADFDGDLSNGLSFANTVDATIAAGTGRTIRINSRDFSPATGGTIRFGSATETGTIVLAVRSLGGGPSLMSVDGGTLRFADAFSSSLLQRVTGARIAQAGTLDLNGFGDSITGLSGAGTLANGGIGKSIALLANDGFNGTIDPGANGLTLLGSLTGLQSFTKGGAGTLTLASNLTTSGFTGGIIIAEGTLSLQGSLDAGFGTIRTDGSVIDFADGVINAAPIQINSNATQLQVIAGSATQSGVISEQGGVRGFEKTGAGTLVLNSANTYSGTTRVSSGTLVINNIAALGNASGRTIVDDGATLTLGAPLVGVGTDEAISISGTGVNNSGAIRALGTNATIRGVVTLEADALVTASRSRRANFLDVTGSNKTLSVAGDGEILIGKLSLGTGAFVVDMLGPTGNRGNVYLQGINTWSGGTFIENGNLQLFSENALPTAGAVTVRNNGALFLLEDTAIGSLAGSGRVILTYGNAPDGRALTVGDAVNTTFSGVISEFQDIGSLVKRGSGTLTLSGANTYSGATRIEAGTISLGANAVIANTSALQIAGGTFALGSFSDAVGSVNLASGAIAGAAGSKLDVMGDYTQSGGMLETGATANVLTNGTIRLSGGTVAGTVNGLRTDNNSVGSIADAGAIVDRGSARLTGTLALGSNLMVGDAGAGSLTIAGGGLVSNRSGVIGRFANSRGSVTVTGANSNWTNTYQLRVGNEGDGELAIEAGGTASALTMFVGGPSPVNGKVLVTGADSTLTGTIAISVGASGNRLAELTVNDAGLVQAENVNIGGIGTGTGKADISDAGSRLLVSNEFNIGFQGKGDLIIADGGFVSSDGTTLATLNIGTATVKVTGAGSRWEDSGNLMVGRAGSGTLTLSEGGAVIAAGVEIGRDAGSTGTVIVGAAQGSAAVAAGTLSAPTIAFGAGAGSIVFNHTDANYELAAAISGNGTLRQLSGTTRLLGPSSDFTGTTVVNGGSLLVTGTLGGSSVTVNGGKLGGTGAIQGNVIVGSGGRLSPGNSPGTLTIAGDLALDSGALLDFELAQAGVVGGGINDQIQVGGNLTLAGTLNVISLPGFGAGFFRLFNYGNALTDNGLQIAGTPGGLTGTVLTNIDRQVNVLFSDGAQLIQYWDGTDTTGNAPATSSDGGAGTWSGGNTNWTTPTGFAVNSNWASQIGVFAGASGGAVSVDGPQAFQELRFETDGYMLAAASAGGALATTGGFSVIDLSSGISAAITAAITGTGGLTKTGAGMLTLGGQNSYAGPTTITAGTLVLSGSGSLAGAVTNNAAFTNAGTVAGLVSNNGSLSSTGTLGAGLTNRAGAAASLAGQVNGAVANSGAITLTNGTTGITAFTQTAEGSLNLAGFATTVGSIAGSGTIAIGTAQLLTGSDNASTRFDGTITGSSGAVFKTGTGTLTLGGASTAGFVNQAGNLVLDSGGTLGGQVDVRGGSFLNRGTVSGLVVNSAMLTSTGVISSGLINNTGAAATVAGAISGDILNAGDLTVTGNLAGGGALTTNGTATVLVNSRANWTAVAGITHNSAAADGIAINGFVTLDSGAALRVNAGASVRLSETGTLTLAGPDTASPQIILAANTNFNNAGTVNSRVFGSGAILNSGTWNGTVAISSGGSVINNGAITGTIATATGSTLASTGTITNGLTNAGTATLLGTLNGDVRNSGALVVTGTLTSNDSLVNAGTGSVAVGSSAVWRDLGNVTNTSTNTSGLTINGTLSATGTISNGTDAFITVGAGGTLNASGITNAEGGTITVIQGGPINDAPADSGVANSGAVDNAGQVKNAGTWTGAVADRAGITGAGINGVSAMFENTSGGTIIGAFDNRGTLLSAGTLSGSLINSGVARLAGTITGPVLNSGKVLTNGNLEHMGAVTNSGVFAIGAGAFATSGTFTNSGSLFVSNGAALALGTAVLRNSGSGALIDIAGTVRGRVDVASGMLIGRAGSLLEGDVLIGSGAALMSGGTIIGNVTINGALLPGNSPGTLTINGALALGSSSTIMMEMSNTASDRIAVTGTASIASGATLVLTGERAATPGQAYTLIKATDGIAGRFTTIIKDRSVFGFIRQDGDSIALFGTLVLSAGITGQGTATVDYLNERLLAGTVSDAGLALTPAVAALDGSALLPVIARLSPEPYASAASMALENGLALAKTVRAVSPTWKDADTGGLYVFGQGFAAGRDFAAQPFGTASAAQVSEGFLGGVGYGNRAVGISAFVGRSSVRQRIVQLGAQTRSRGTFIGAKAQLAAGGVRFSASALFDRSDADTSRAPVSGAAQANYTLHGETFDAELAYDLRIGDGGLQLRPSAGVTHTRVTRGAVGETGGGAAALSVVRQSYKATWINGEIALRAGSQSAVQPWIGVGVRHLANGDPIRATGSLAGFGGQFTVQGAQAQRTFAHAAGGVSANLGGGLSTYLTGEVDVTRQGGARQAQGGIRYAF